MYVIGTLYRPTSHVEDIGNILTYLSTFADVVFCVGDLNISMFYPNNNFTECFETYGLFQIINEATIVT